MIVRAEPFQSGSLKSDISLDLSKSNLPFLPPPTYWLFRTNQTQRLVAWSTKTLHDQPIGKSTTSPPLELLLDSTTVTVLGLLLGPFLGAEKAPTKGP